MTNERAVSPGAGLLLAALGLAGAVRDERVRLIPDPLRLGPGRVRAENIFTLHKIFLLYVLLFLGQLAKHCFDSSSIQIKVDRLAILINTTRKRIVFMSCRGCYD